MATVEYVHFKNGADVHTFWPLPFAPYWALSVGVLARTLLDLARPSPPRASRHARGERCQRTRSPSASSASWGSCRS